MADINETIESLIARWNGGDKADTAVRAGTIADVTLPAYARLLATLILNVVGEKP